MATLRNKTIGEVQAEFEAVLARIGEIPLPHGLDALKTFVPPRGMIARVSLRNRETQRQIRRTADASRWNPAICEVVISYELDEESDDDSDSSANSSRTTNADPLVDLIKALDAAERDPRFREFVGIKSFRDKYLVAQGYAWALDAIRRHAVLSGAIDQGLVLRNSVPNPKDPSYPTTSVRINREHPDVKRILAASVGDRATFKPVFVPGAALSSTVLAERR
jgi:hypothetical protein